MKLKAFLTVAVVLSFLSCQKQGSPTSTKVETEDDKIFYSVGVMFGQRLQNLELNDKELAAIYAGLYESATNKKLRVEPAEYQRKVQEAFNARMKMAADKTKEAGKKFIDEFVSKEGAQKTASGLAYKIIQEGTGPMPKETDIVEVHYHGTLPDGTVFDSSVERKEKVSFPLNRVIKGWTEGLQLLKTGGKMKMVIPSDLAYGDQGAPPKIPGGATLVFEVELFSVKSEAEAKKEAEMAEKKEKSAMAEKKTESKTKKN